MTSVLFVCLGNICRSPMAEAVFKSYVNSKSYPFSRIDSAGTAAYHVGEEPDSRSVETCNKNGVSVDHFARQIKKQDLQEFDYILCMDESNLANVQRLGNGKAKVMLFGEFDPEGEKIVKDPYYGGIQGFQRNFDQCVRMSKGFCAHLGLE